MRILISAEVDFCNTFHAKCMFFQSQTPKFRPKNQLKKQPGNRYEKIFFLGLKMPKKLSEWVPQIIKKSTKSKPGPHRVLPCALQCPRIVPGSSQDRPRTGPGSPQDRPRVPQDGKVEAPSMPNDIHGYQNPPKTNKNQGLDLKVLFCCLKVLKKLSKWVP